MSYNSGSNRARNFKSASGFAFVRFWNYSRDYSLNCTPLGPITITNHTSDNKIGRPGRGSPICFITSMITDRIGRHEILLPINHKNYNFQGKNSSQAMKKGKIYIKRLTKETQIVKCRSRLWLVDLIYNFNLNVIGWFKEQFRMRLAYWTVR